MVKSIKKWSKYLLYTLGVVILLLLILLLLARTSWFQNFLADKAANYLSKELQVKVEVETIDIKFFNMVSLNGLYVEDLHGDTLMYANEMTLTIGYFKTTPIYALVNNIYLQNTKVKLQKYKDEEHLNLQFIVDYFASDDTTKKKNNVHFNITSLELANIDFSYANHQIERKEWGIDYNHIHTKNVNMFVSNLSIVNDSISGVINNLSLNEHSGFTLERLIAKADITPNHIELLKLNIKTNTSLIRGKSILEYNGYEDFSDFINKVKMNFNLKNSTVDINDVAYFAPGLKGFDKITEFDGRVYGYINNLKGKSIKIKTDDGSRLYGNFDLNGLPDINNTFAFIQLKEISSSKKQLETFPMFPLDKKEKLKIPDAIAGLGNITFKGDYTGFINDFVLYGKFYTDAGNLSTDVSLKQDSGKNISKYSGQISSDNLAINKIIKNEYIGRTSFDLRIDGDGLDIETMKAKIAGRVNYADINKNRYEIITLDGIYSGKVFDGCVTSRDEKLDFDFYGTIDLKGKVPKYNFTSTIYNSKPAKLGLMDRSGMKTRFSGNLYINMEGTNIDNMIGSFRIEDANYKDIQDEFLIDTFIVKSYFAENKERHLDVISDIADISFVGNFKFNELDKTFKHFIGVYLPYYEEYRSDEYASTNNIKFSANIKDASLITKLFTEGIYYEKGAYLSGSYYASTKSLNYDMKIPLLNINGTYINDFNLVSNTRNENMEVVITALKIQLTDSFAYENFRMKSTMNSDSLNLLIHIHSKDTSETTADIRYRGRFDESRAIIGEFYDSEMFFTDEKWMFNENNKVSIDTNSVDIKNLKITSEKSLLYVNGIISKNPEEKVEVQIENFDLSNLDKFLASAGIKLRGNIRGTASLADILGAKKFSSDLEVDSFALNETKLGNGKILNKWSGGDQSLHTDAVFKIDGVPTFNLSGDYNFADKNEALNYILSFTSAPLNIFEFAIEDYVSDLKGSVSGYARIKGKVNQPKINGKLELHDLEVKVDYLNTTYKTNTTVFIDEDMFAINDATLYDEEDNKASLNATILHNNFKDFNMDIGLYTRKFLFMNTNEFQNKLFYGKAILSGQANISGYADQLIMDAEVKTEKGTLLNIPLSDETEIGENNLVTFINNGAEKVDEEELDLSNILMNFKMEVTPDAEVRLIFDEQIGDVIKSRGEGDIIMEINTKGDFNIFGTYTIVDGDYLFTLQNVINKRFTLEKGGTISWNGDPIKAQLDINAIYRLRASPYDLMVGDSLSRAKYKNRIPIEVKLKMENDLMNPDITFDIEAPSATQEVRDRLASITYVSNNQSNANEMNKQVFALLILNRFIPPQGGNPDNAARSGFGSTTGFETMSNQLSNWLSQITDKFDVGFNYRPGDAITSQEVEVALSTQILNDRVVLDGNVGSVGNTTTQTNNLVGEFSVEYKITEDGKLRIKAFNEANTNIDVQTQGLYTQGVGLFFRHEFNKFFDKEEREERKKKKAEKQKAKEEEKDKRKNSK